MDNLQNNTDEPVLIEKVSFSLTTEEALNCLKKARVIKTTGKRASIYCIILGICAVAFFADFLIKKDYNPLIFSILSLAIIAIIIIAPNISLNKLAKENSNGKIIGAEIFSDKIVIGKGEESWNINLDNSCAVAQENNMYIFFTKDKQLFAIPKRAISQDNSQEIEKLIIDGTNEYN